MASVALPIVLFAGLTVVSQIVSPARGQSLLPSLPSIATRALPQGGSVETYADPGRVGVNQFHLIFSAPPSVLASIHPRVIASPLGGTPVPLRQLRVSEGHFSEVLVVGGPGPWRFRVTTPYGRSTVSFTVPVTFPSG
jgi:hypothetical protein